MNHPELIPYAGTFGESMISWTVVESGRALPPPAQPALSKNGIPHARMAEGRRKVNMFPTLFSCFATTLLCIVGLVVNVYGLSSSDLIFYLPFDGTLAPGYSAGEGKYSLTGSTISAVSFERGIKGQALSAGMKDYRYIFPSAGNINPQEGTLSFWVKPLDWEPAQEDLPAQHAFFGLWGNDEYVLLYKYFGAVKYLVKKGNRTWMLEWWPSDWKKGEWRHFALTWKGGLHRFHVNGKLVGELPDVAWAENLPAMLITSLAYNTSSDKPSTAFDELKIFNRFFSEGEIRILMARDQGGYNPPDLTIPLAQSRPIRIDGRIDTREWDGAVQTTGFITLFTQGWAKEQPRVWLAADTEKMYVAWQWDHGAEPLSQDMIGRDSAVYMDDSFEFWIDPRGTGAPATLVQFIGNARGSIYDSLNGNAAWNGKWEYQCRDEAGVWSAELAIAWRDLSGAPPQSAECWRLNLCRNFAGGAAMASSLSYAAKGLFADPGNFIRVHYGTDTPVIRIRELGQLEYGLVNLHLEILNPANEVRPVSVRIIGRIAPDAGKPELNDSTLLDTKVEVSPAGKEIVLFKRLLQDKNIRELAVQVNDAKTGTFLYRADLPVSVAAGYEVTYSPHPGTGVFKVIIDPLYAPIFNKPRNVGVQIRGKGSTKPALEKTIRVQTGRQGIVDFPEQKIPVGDDEIVVIVKEPGIVEEQRTIVPFHRPERPAEWEIDRPGREPGVPPPWIPVTLQGNTLSLWGRTVTFGTSLLPVQMTSQGIPMLTEPIRMISGKENEPMPLQDESCKAVRKDTEGIEVETRAIGPDNLRISSKIRTEFDGVMRVDLTIIPPKHGVTLNRLAVRIPLSGNVATQYVLDNRFAFLPFGRSVFGRTTHLWIGNDDAGLCWFTENFAGWNLPDDGSGGIVINRTERETTLQIWMIDVPTRITTPLTFTFGLLATPCKPLPKDWQMRDFQGYNPGHYKKIGFTEEDYAREQYYQIFSQDVFFDPVLLTWRKPSEREPREDLRKLRENGHNCVAWSQFTTVGRNVPDYCYYGEEWRVFPSGANWQGAGGINLFAVCPKSSWGDCLVKGVEKMAQIGFNGQYFDTGTLSLCRNPFHGCGYLSRDGRMERTIPFFAAREIKKRIYKVLYKEFGAKGQPFYISTLCNGDLQWPMLTFDTAVVSGEEWNGRLADDLDYTKILTLPEWRVKFWPVKWGFIHVPIPSLADLDSWENRTAFETLSIYRLSAGTPIWPCQNPFMYVKLWRVQRAFGVQEGLEFHPCWESPPYITAVNKKTTVAFYRNENELLVTVCNFDEKPVDELLTFTLKKIGLAGMIREAFDLYHEEKIAVRENILSFPMEPKTFRMIRVTMEH